MGEGRLEVAADRLLRRDLHREVVVGAGEEPVLALVALPAGLPPDVGRALRKGAIVGRRADFFVVPAPEEETEKGQGNRRRAHPQDAHAGMVAAPHGDVKWIS